MHAQEGRRTRRTPRPATSPATAAPSRSRSLADLQGTVGNAAVGRMLAGRATAVQRMPGSDGQQEQPSTVISGHGRFGDNQRLPKNPDNPRSRALKATFTVPAGVELVVYAPPGAWLENEVANRVESGNPPTTDELELVGDNNKRKPMPPDYPKTFRAGEEVINYKLMPLDARHLAEGAVSVDAGTLRDKVQELLEAREDQGEDAPPLTIHYACCGVGSSSVPEIDRLFVHRNYTVMMRTTPRTPSPEPEAPPKRRRKG
ncbi:putative adhesin [Kitasatospora sp. NPDC001539]|uniref:putative adhesin n=1 Tax=unclassified Kitasatospora TaxID=2633591 RepID=UPI003325C22C